MSKCSRLTEPSSPHNGKESNDLPRMQAGLHRIAEGFKSPTLGNQGEASLASSSRGTFLCVAL